MEIGTDHGKATMARPFSLKFWYSVTKSCTQDRTSQHHICSHIDVENDSENGLTAGLTSRVLIITMIIMLMTMRSCVEWAAYTHDYTERQNLTL